MFNYQQNKKMKVFSQLYVGLKEQHGEQPALGFATPYENNAAFEKRKKTIDDWCGGWEYERAEDGMYKHDERGGYVRHQIVPNTRIIENVSSTEFLFEVAVFEKE